MVTFKEIEKSFEAKFAHDEELKFRAHARCNHLLGEWAAQKLNLAGPQTEAYARDLVMADLDRPGTDAVLNRIRADFAARDVPLSEQQIRQTMDELFSTVLEHMKADG
jgi:hypothetical protein